MNWYISVLKKYAVFSGRASRKEYWMFILFNIIFGIIASIIDSIIGIKIYGSGLIINLYTLAILIPSLAVSVRRLHDTGRSGWWLLIESVPIIGIIWMLIPTINLFWTLFPIMYLVWILISIIGSIWFFVLTLLKGNPGDNKYGPDPKAAAAVVSQAQS